MSESNINDGAVPSTSYSSDTITTSTCNPSTSFQTLKPIASSTSSIIDIPHVMRIPNQDYYDEEGVLHINIDEEPRTSDNNQVSVDPAFKTFADLGVTAKEAQYLIQNAHLAYAAAENASTCRLHDEKNGTTCELLNHKLTELKNYVSALQNRIMSIESERNESVRLKQEAEDKLSELKVQYEAVLAQKMSNLNNMREIQKYKDDYESSQAVLDQLLKVYSDLKTRYNESIKYANTFANERDLAHNEAQDLMVQLKRIKLDHEVQNNNTMDVLNSFVNLVKKNNIKIPDDLQMKFDGLSFSMDRDTTVIEDDNHDIESLAKSNSIDQHIGVVSDSDDDDDLDLQLETLIGNRNSEELNKDKTDLNSKRKRRISQRSDTFSITNDLASTSTKRNLEKNINDKSVPVRTRTKRPATRISAILNNMENSEDVPDFDYIEQPKKRRIANTKKTPVPTSLISNSVTEKSKSVDGVINKSSSILQNKTSTEQVLTNSTILDLLMPDECSASNTLKEKDQNRANNAEDVTEVDNNPCIEPITKTNSVDQNMGVVNEDNSLDMQLGSLIGNTNNQKITKETIPNNVSTSTTNCIESRTSEAPIANSKATTIRGSQQITMPKATALSRRQPRTVPKTIPIPGRQLRTLPRTTAIPKRQTSTIPKTAPIPKRQPSTKPKTAALPKRLPSTRISRSRRNPIDLAADIAIPPAAIQKSNTTTAPSIHGRKTLTIREQQEQMMSKNKQEIFERLRQEQANSTPSKPLPKPSASILKRKKKVGETNSNVEAGEPSSTSLDYC